MSIGFWIKRFFTVLVAAFVVIFAAQVIKSHDFRYAGTQAVIWAVITATVFTIGRVIQSRRGQHCAICKDTPEMQESGRSH
jgi:uncharacterized membrane protein YvlD (DUF360 family)